MQQNQMKPGTMFFTAPGINPGVNPVYGGVNPMYGGVNPMYGGVNPMYGGVNPMYGGVNPMYGGVNPMYGGVNPINPGVNPINPGVNPINPVPNPINPAPNPINPAPNPQPQAAHNMQIKFFFYDVEIQVQGNSNMTIQQLIKNFRTKLCSPDTKIDKYLIHPSKVELDPYSTDIITSKGIKENTIIYAIPK